MSVPRNRHDAIRAVAKRYLNGTHLPYWSDEEYLHGQVALIVDVFGADGAEEGGERSFVYDEVLNEWQAMRLEEQAHAWLDLALAGVETDTVATVTVRALIKRAYLAGVDSTRSDHG